MMPHQATRHEHAFARGAVEMPHQKISLGDDGIIQHHSGKGWDLEGNNPPDSGARTGTIIYFILAVLGFSSWFLMVVPFASHRESYSWLAGVPNQHFAQEFSFGLSSTYRPLAQAATWLGFLILDPHVFPTDILRQALLQGFIYAMFVLAWWLIYFAAPQRRAFALVACVVGGVFFSGYIQLFHVYGLFYVPVMLTLGALLRFHASDTFEKRELWFAVVATVLALWHPFATALFVGFYFGFYLDTFDKRSKAQHIQAVVILVVGILAIAALVIVFPRAQMPLDTKLFGFLVSYQTNEINRVASLVAFLLAQTVVLSMGFPPRVSLAAFLVVSALSVVFLLKGVPLLLLWICAVLFKLLHLRCWSLLFLTFTAALLPLGGGIGTPIYALFATIAAAYVTPLGWPRAEKALRFIKTRYVTGTVIASAIVLLLVRVGIEVPIVTRVASPLLTERERTYQLEDILAWLHSSSYCGYDIAFVDNAGSPIDDVESAITRRHRPPAALEDVRLFWKRALQCQNSEGHTPGTAVVTFGGPALPELSPVFEVKGRYAGDATVWIADSQMGDRNSTTRN